MRRRGGNWQSLTIRNSGDGSRSNESRRPIKIHRRISRRAIRYQPAMLRWRNTISTIRKRGLQGENRSCPFVKETEAYTCVRVYATVCNVYHLADFAREDRSIGRAVVHACYRLFLELFTPRDRDSEAHQLSQQYDALSRTSYCWMRESY